MQAAAEERCGLPEAASATLRRATRYVTIVPYTITAMAFPGGIDSVAYARRACRASRFSLESALK
jgi:hypothetical protein